MNLLHHFHMWRLLCFSLVFFAISGCTTSPPRNIENLCEIFDQKRGWKKDAQAASKRWGTPVHVMMAILRHESSFRADAKPPRKKILWVIPGGRISSAYGYSQALDGTWKSYKKATGSYFADRDDFDDAIDFVGWYTNLSARKLGISKWDTYSQYLAYHEGQGGYARGTYKRKGWLMKTARRVDSTSKRYATQLKRCD
jgi:hypothetical protein